LHYKLLTWYGLYLIAFMLLGACSSSKEASADGEFTSADLTPEKLVQQMKTPGESLTAVQGKSKALISQPGNTDKATLTFKSTRTQTLVEIKNRIGIDGGLLFLTSDSVLLYNRVDNYAKKTDRRSGQLPELSGISPINILQILDYQFQAEDVSQINTNGEIIKAILTDNTLVELWADTRRISSISQPYRSDVPFTKLVFEGYSSIKGYSLPRKITIINSNRNTKVVLLMQNLDVNSKNMIIEPDIPRDITIQRL